ncbi:MAG TPA: MmgE/PrpD family protein [Nitrolancea sp.]
MDETRKLATFVVDSTFESLPASVVERAKTYVLDCLGCGFVGAPQPWAKIVADMAQDVGGKGEGSMFTLDWQAPVSLAALVNGVMIGGFESEHIGHVSHPAGTVFPAAFAIAEREHTSGRDFVTALALGYELVCRIGDAQTGAVEIVRGFHNPAANGPFSGAAVTGKLLGFDAETLANALGIAGSHSGGLIEYVWHGEMTKRLHLGRASQMGMESAFLAQRGFTGPATIIEGPYGYLHAFSPSPEPEKLLSGLGEEWRMEKLTIKAYANHATSQAPVAAIQAFKRDVTFDPSQVESLTIKASGRLLEERFLDRAPTSLMGAQYSLIFATATAIYRDLDDPLQFDESALSDQGILQLAQKIQVEEIAGGTQLEIRIGGQTHQLEATTFVGAADNPASFDVVANKFRRFSQHALSAPQQDAMIEMVQQLDRVDDMSRLASSVSGDGSAA